MIKLPHNKSWRLRGGGRNVGLPSYFDIWHNQDDRVVSSTHQLHLTEIPWYVFSVRCRVDPRFTEFGQKESVTWKLLWTLPGIECRNSCLVVQYLNQLCHCLPTLMPCSHLVHMVVGVVVVVVVVGGGRGAAAVEVVAVVAVVLVFRRRRRRSNSSSSRRRRRKSSSSSSSSSRGGGSSGCCISISM